MILSMYSKTENLVTDRKRWIRPEQSILRMFRESTQGRGKPPSQPINNSLTTTDRAILQVEESETEHVCVRLREPILEMWCHSGGDCCSDLLSPLHKTAVEDSINMYDLYHSNKVKIYL